MSKFSIAEFFKKNVTLPNTVITVYTDGAAAWQYGEVREKVEALKREQELLVMVKPNVDKATVGSITEVSGAALQAERLDEIERELEELQTVLTASLEQIAASGVKVHMRALYPSEMEVADDKATRVARERFKDKPTPPKDQMDLVEAKLTNAMFFSTAVTKMEYPNGNVVDGPINFSDFEAIEEYLNANEYGKLIAGLRELNMTQAMRDAQGDAGFPGRLPEQTGEQ